LVVLAGIPTGRADANLLRLDLPDDIGEGGDETLVDET
jgi:hypothetical protein